MVLFCGELDIFDWADLSWRQKNKLSLVAAPPAVSVYCLVYFSWLLISQQWAQKVHFMPGHSPELRFSDSLVSPSLF